MNALWLITASIWNQSGPLVIVRGCFLLIIIIIMVIRILNKDAVHGPFDGIGSIRQHWTPSLRMYLSYRPHSLTLFFTHSNPIFLGFSHSLVPGIHESSLWQVWCRYDTCTLYMPRPFELPTVRVCRNNLNAKFLVQWSWWCFLLVSGTTDPAALGAVITLELLQVRGIRSPSFATMEHSKMGSGWLHLAAHLRYTSLAAGVECRWHQHLNQAHS